MATAVVAVTAGAAALAEGEPATASAAPTAKTTAPHQSDPASFDLLTDVPSAAAAELAVFTLPTAVAAAPAPVLPTITTTAKPGTSAAAAIEFALAQRGLPYVWGGDGPAAGEEGFDCSGLTTAAYAYTGVDLPRTAHTQYYAGPHVPAGAEPEPGDLVFYGVPERVHHVGLYLGDGMMINAPTFGKPVRLAYVRYPGDDYLGATRPAAGHDAPGLLESPELPFPVPQVPAPDAPPAPTEFPAPPAPDGTDASGPVLAAQDTNQADGATTAMAMVMATNDPAGPDDGPAASDAATTTSPLTTDAGDAGASTTTPTTTPATTTQAATTTSRPPTRPDPADGAPTTAAASQPGAAAPTAVLLPGGLRLDLVPPPGAPAEPARAELLWRPGEDGAWTATVALPADVDPAVLTDGAVVVLVGPDGTVTELTVGSRRTVDAATAAGIATATADGPRLVLLSALDNGSVRVVVAS